MTGLSILIPTFNDECLTLVKALQSQCQTLKDGNAATEGLDYEIIVADDGSTDTEVKKQNSAIATLPHCNYIERPVNSGRASIRNFLAREASFSELLFIDSDMTVIREDFVYNYVRARGNSDVVYGGYDVPEQTGLERNLRYRYERACRKAHTAEQRRKSPYMDFHTSNFMIPRDTMLAHPLDEHFRHYGYEDVAFGEELRKSGIAIKHIDNPVGFCRFESNENFITKTEESIRTLVEFSQQLHNYSRLLQTTEKLDKFHLRKVCRLILSILERPLRRALISRRTPLPFLNIYKLSYLLNCESD